MANMVVINRTGRTLPVVSASTGAKVGDIYNKELFIDTGGNGIDTSTIWFYSPTGWRQGVVETGGVGVDGAYTEDYDYGGQLGGEHNFKLRRQCRIFKSSPGSTVDSGASKKYDVAVHTTLQAGDQIITNGYSEAGYQNPMLTHVIGYIKSGVVTRGISMWADTDIEIGYSMYNQVTPYGMW